MITISRKYTAFAILALSLTISYPAISAESSSDEQTTVMTRIQEIKERTSKLVSKAFDFIGTRYTYGGNTRETGLDCSGLVKLVFKDAANINLPRTAAELSRVGEQVDRNELQPGDLVFFNTLRRSFSHVGIYLGDNKFIHAPSSGGQVRIESMEISYWKSKFSGARRVNDDQPSH